MNFSDSITSLSGIGPKKAELLRKMGIETVGDMLNFFPRAYQDRRNVRPISEIRAGETALIRGAVVQMTRNRFPGRGKRLLKVTVDDGSGRAEILYFNADYLKNQFEIGEEYFIYGSVSRSGIVPQMAHPEFSRDGKDFFGIFPIYPLTDGIHQRELRKWQTALRPVALSAEEFLPPDLVRRHHLCSYAYALSNIHFPEDEKHYRKAKYRLVFNEMLILQTGLFALRSGQIGKQRGIFFDPSVSVSEYIDSLPYPLTGAQKRAVSEILADMESEREMRRLLQGDVGSGKTAVAEIAMFKAASCGFQAVLMAPTEILAQQHYEGICRSFSAFGIPVGFLSGSLSRKEREETLRKLASGEISILIGTHAVIQPDVRFRRLGLVITDEQHRFGVQHRVLLGEKGENPDQLIMTATPIPRTLAVILYGDLDISVLDELPPGRKKIRTEVIGEDRRDAMYEFVRKQLSAGHQAYVVAPMIEDSEEIKVRSAEGIYTELKARFPEFEIALLHGELPQKEKEEIMRRFADGKIALLVATVVIEVGINVPNATVMVIENSERFGLAQLHQLRGRVGRGGEKSWCILVNAGQSGVARTRAEIMAASDSGFVIAEKDLQLRGPGEFFGTRQHGLPDLRISNLIRHVDLLEIVKEEALHILQEDSELSLEKNAPLRREILRMFRGKFELKM